MVVRQRLAWLALATLAFSCGIRAQGEPAAGVALDPGPAHPPVDTLGSPLNFAFRRMSQGDSQRQRVLDYLERFHAAAATSASNAGASAAAEPPRRPPAGEARPGEAAAAGCASAREASDAVLSGPCTLGRGMREKRYLVVLPAGDRFDANRWLPDPAAAAFDLIIIHFGRDESFECWQCKKMYRGAGAKWRLVYQLFSRDDWPVVSRQYAAIMVPDDDLIMDTCMINRAFQLFERHNLLIAQPSVCDVSYAAMIWPWVRQVRSNILRYVTFVEVQAPIFQKELFDNFIGPTLANARIGWGLDSLWPFLLKYPRDRLAILDDVCMIHPQRVKEPGTNLYDSTGGDGIAAGWAEEGALYSAWGYGDAAIAALGYNVTARDMKLVLGHRPQAAPERLRDEARSAALVELCHEADAERARRVALAAAGGGGSGGARPTAVAGAETAPAAVMAAWPGPTGYWAVVPCVGLLLLMARRHRGALVPKRL